jgi:hypothetical protein
MKKVLLAVSFLAVVVLAVGASAQEMSAEEKAVMEAWQKAGTPGEPHKKLEALVGEWKAHSKVWSDPSAPPVESEATSSTRTIFDGRYIEQKYEGEWMGQPFHGISIWGYDNLRKKFVSTWIDSTATSIFYSEGEWDAEKKAIVFHGESADPVTEKMEKLKAVVRFDSDDKHVFEMFMIGEDGKEVRNMEIIYTKKVPGTE